jgi:23S rRNA (cytidine2498-2'-O)-methyltransferase
MISRAEFKLLEALETFNIELPKRGTALDLGAAPGGWTRLLLERGLRVVAVDPANMHPTLKANRNLEHYRGHAEPFLESAFSQHRLFDIVCNDMRMDARQAARLMLHAADLLPVGGLAITSLKLPHATSGMQPRRVMAEALEILQVGFEEVHARQLFHNRQEVTVFLKK